MSPDTSAAVRRLDCGLAEVTDMRNALADPAAGGTMGLCLAVGTRLTGGCKDIGGDQVPPVARTELIRPWLGISREPDRGGEGGEACLGE